MEHNPTPHVLYIGPKLSIAFNKERLLKVETQIVTIESDSISIRHTEDSTKWVLAGDTLKYFNNNPLVDLVYCRMRHDLCE